MSRKLNPYAIAVQIIVLFVLLLVSIPTSAKYSTRVKMVQIFMILVAASLLIYDNIVVERFFFEVSPERAKCLKEQVSRNNFGKNRSCACCGKGTVGGIPPNYAEWLDTDPDTGDQRWHRPDAVEWVDTFSNSEEAVCRPFTQPSYIRFL